MADEADSKSVAGDRVRVQVPLPAVIQHPWNPYKPRVSGIFTFRMFDYLWLPFWLLDSLRTTIIAVTVSIWSNPTVYPCDYFHLFARGGNIVRIVFLIYPLSITYQCAAHGSWCAGSKQLWIQSPSCSMYAFGISEPLIRCPPFHISRDDSCMNTSIHIRENELSQIAVFFLDIFNLFKKLSDFDRQWEDPRLSVFRRRDVKSVCQSI